MRSWLEKRWVSHWSGVLKLGRVRVFLGGRDLAFFEGLVAVAGCVVCCVDCVVGCVVFCVGFV